MLLIFKKNWFIIAYLTAFFLVSSLVVLNRFWQYEVFYFDHGLFDQSIWNVARFRLPYIDHHFVNGQLLQLGDHFSWSIYLLVPIYWLTSSYAVIFIVENFLVCTSAFLLYLAGQKKRIDLIWNFAICIAYTFFIGMQNAIIANFHPELMALFFLSLCFYFLEIKKIRLFWLSFLLCLGCKETLAAMGFCLGIYCLANNRKLGLQIMFFSLIYYLSSVYLIIPLISGHRFFYQPNQENLSFPNIFLSFFIPTIKIRTLFFSLLNFGFLPFFSIWTWPLILQDYFVRFVIDGAPSRIDLGLHYNAVSSLLLAYGAICALTVTARHRWFRKFSSLAAIILIFIVFIMHWRLRGPLGLSINPAFYAHTKNFVFLNEFVKRIPKAKLLMTQNNLAPHLTHSQSQLMLLREDYWKFNPDVIAIDVREGQNPNNYWPLPPQQFVEFIANLKKDSHYRLKILNDNQLLFTLR